MTTLQTISIGTSPNDGTGDDLRAGAQKINDNFQLISDKVLTGSFQIISQLSDLPAPVANVIALSPDTTYYFITKIDLLGNSITLSPGTVLRGTSSINSGLFSTVALVNPMLTSASSIDILNLSFDGTYTGSVFISCNGDESIDNIYVNNTTVLGFENLGSIIDYSSVFFYSCTFSDCGNLEFDGTIGTLSIDNCLGIPKSSSVLLTMQNSLTITRRARIIYSSFVCDSLTAAIEFLTTIIPDESYILDTCNFSGASTTYITGLDHTSNKSLFVNCKGITNTAVIGQAYMQGNATATVISSSSTFTKVLGTTTAGANNSKYTHSNNRLTCGASIERKFLVICQLSFTSGNNQTCEFGFYDSTISGIRVPSRTTVTTNGAGIAENVSFTSVISHKLGDYIEVHCANNTSATNITVQSMNFIITEIK